jgi:hypothetical protein
VHQFTVLVSSAMLTEATKYGLGMHFEDMDWTKMSTLAWLNIGAGFSTILGATWSKTSFAITLMRLSSSRWMKYLIWFIIISTNLVLGMSATMMWIQCWPVAKLWHSEMEGSCWPGYVVQNYMTFAAGMWLSQTILEQSPGLFLLTQVLAYSGALDIILAILPWKIVWKVAINKKEKIGALVAMSMGVLYVPQTALTSGILPFVSAG